MATLEKCPYCGSMSMGILPVNSGTSYVITEVDTSQNPASFLSTAGIVVKLYGCHKCKGIVLKCPDIGFIPDEK